MVSGTMAITRATLWAGSGAISAQRGLEAWGANWVFNKNGSQNDLLVIAEEFKNLSTSGAYATDAEVAAASGAAVITASGGAVAVATSLISAASGAATALSIANIAAASGAAVVAGSGAARGGIAAGIELTGMTFVTSMIPSTSGTAVLAAQTRPMSGIYMMAWDTKVPMFVVAYSNGLVSGVAV